MDHYVSNHGQASVVGNVLKTPLSAEILDLFSRFMYLSLSKFSSIARHIIVLFMSFSAAVMANNAVAAQLTFTWYPNSEPHLAGYKLHYGETSGKYTSTVDIGNKTSYTVSDLQGGKIYYFAVTAYDTTGTVKSEFSNEVSAIIPSSDVAPTADFSANSTSGIVPLIVTFNDTSTGNIDTRSWNFGDGGASVGQTAVYTYQNAGNFTVNLTVKGPGGTDTETKPNYITVLANPSNDSTIDDDIHGGSSDGDPVVDDNPREATLVEANEVEVDHQWQRVTFTRSFVDPVVIAKPLSYRDNDPAVIRIRNVDNTGFDIRIQEWEYLDDTHYLETVGYLAMERGSHALADGTRVEAGQFKANKTGSITKVKFNEVFQKTPVVLTAVTTFRGSDAVVTRVRNINTADFRLKLQNQEANSNTHQAETISYIAWEPSTGTVDDVVFEVDRTAKAVTHQPHRIAFQKTHMDVPVFLADMQTMNGGDTANLRWESKDIYSVDVHINEEHSKDNETYHVSETLGYVLISPIQ